MKKACLFYINHIHAIGALMSIVPVTCVYAYMFTFLPFREVYLLRFVVSLIIGGIAGAYSNSFAVNNWLARVKVKNAKLGIIIGSAAGLFAGVGTNAIPPLLSLISSNHIEYAKNFIIISWIIGAVNGILIGGSLGYIGSKYLFDS
jgi:hypothetical protein